MRDRREVWQRGPVEGYEPLLMPVVHALLQAQEDMLALADGTAADHAWERPGGAASIAFHLRHVAGSVDRLLTYARGDVLTDTQRRALAAEADVDRSTTLRAIAEESAAALDRALAQVKSTPRDQLLDVRTVGRAALPSTVLGLLFHAAEHATRHVGQAITTARILTAAATPAP
jgi:uncharacterized damage-inducible protein DinB